MLINCFGEWFEPTGIRLRTQYSDYRLTTKETHVIGNNWKIIFKDRDEDEVAEEINRLIKEAEINNSPTGTNHLTEHEKNCIKEYLFNLSTPDKPKKKKA